MQALQRYMKQKSLADTGSGPSGAGGGPATPVAPGMADPFTQGDFAPPEVNPTDGQNEFDPKRRMRPYLDNGQNMWPQMPPPPGAKY